MCPVHIITCMGVCVFYGLNQPQLTLIINLSSHYCSPALRDTSQLRVVVNLANISKIIWEARTLNTVMSLHGFITVFI